MSDRIELRAILFPHSQLRLQDLKKILPIFGPITVFQPWYMEPPPFISQNDFKDAVKVLNPPSYMKPGEGFRGILSEYKTWIKQHRDKSSAAFLKTSRNMGSDGNATWEIREALRGESHNNRQKREVQQALRWHLTLHLARDFEEDRREADRLLKDLKERKSPLNGLLGEEDVKNPLTDLTQFESGPQTALYPMDQVFEAWFGLFGGYLTSSELLLTFSRHIIDCAAEFLEAAVKVRENRTLKKFSEKNIILVEEELEHE